jgi:hypothetical protein
MFGKGKINISIPKSHYLPGDIISGDVDLKLKKPVQAREMSLSLIGEQESTRVSGITSSGGTSTSTQTIRIYDFKHQLDGEKEYSQGHQYHFEIKIPADILSMRPQMPEGVLGTGLEIVRAAAAMTGAIPYQQTRWYLLAKLDIPGGLDVSKKADITIG